MPPIHPASVQPLMAELVPWERRCCAAKLAIILDGDRACARVIADPLPVRRRTRAARRRWRAEGGRPLVEVDGGDCAGGGKDEVLQPQQEEDAGLLSMAGAGCQGAKAPRRSLCL